MGFFRWAVLVIGIAIVVLLSVIAYYLKQNLYAPNGLSQLGLIRQDISGCYDILRDISEERAREYQEEYFERISKQKE